jgi:hypothetical protein
MDELDTNERSDIVPVVCLAIAICGGGVREAERKLLSLPKILLTTCFLTPGLRGGILFELHTVSIQRNEPLPAKMHRAANPANPGLKSLK